MAFTSATGRTLNAYGGVQPALAGTPQAPSAAPFSREPLSWNAPAMAPEKSLTTAAQALAPATSNTLLCDRIFAAVPTPTA